jgi:N-acetylglucosaminyl-diphospho-decaprenol L-rhamnosyltransferase
VTPGNGPALTVVVVTYNSAPVLPGLFASLDLGLEGVDGIEVVVVDNASSDGSADLARRLVPAATVVDAGGNVGYAAAINLGLRSRLHRGAVLVLNPDVRLTPGAAGALLRALDDPTVGIAVPRIEDEDGALQLSLRRAPTVVRALGEAVVGGTRAGRLPCCGEMVTDRRVYRSDADADWATGAALAIAPRCLDAVGDWDESFFLYSEETDYALRAGDAGLRVRYVAGAVVTHIGGEAHRSPRLWALLVRNRVRLYRKRHGAARAAAFWSAVVLNEVIRSRHATHRAAARALLWPRSPGR